MAFFVINYIFVKSHVSLSMYFVSLRTTQLTLRVSGSGFDKQTIANSTMCRMKKTSRVISFNGIKIMAYCAWQSESLRYLCKTRQEQKFRSRHIWFRSQTEIFEKCSLWLSSEVLFIMQFYPISRVICSADRPSKTSAKTITWITSY